MFDHQHINKVPYLRTTIKNYSFFLPLFIRIKRVITKPKQTKPKITIITVPLVQDTKGVLVNFIFIIYIYFKNKYMFCRKT